MNHRILLKVGYLWFEIINLSQSQHFSIFLMARIRLWTAAMQPELPYQNRNDDCWISVLKALNVYGSAKQGNVYSFDCCVLPDDVNLWRSLYPEVGFVQFYAIEFTCIDSNFWREKVILFCIFVSKFISYTLSFLGSSHFGNFSLCIFLE